MMYKLYCHFLLFKLTLLMFFLTPTSVIAHPHSWIDLKTFIEGSETELTGFHMQWTFDAMSTAYMLEGYDLSSGHKNKSLSVIAEQTVANLLNEHYFTYFYDGKQPIRYKQAINAHLRLEGARAVLEFDLPLSKPKPLTTDKLRLLIFEPSYYVDMSWRKKQDVQLSSKLARQCQLTLREPNPTPEQISYALSLPEDVDPDNELGQLFTQTIILTCNTDPFIKEPKNEQ